MKKSNEELFNEVVTILKEGGLEFKKNNDGGNGNGVRTKDTEMGNYLCLRLVRGVFIPTIYNKKTNEGILGTIDTLVKKIIFEKFQLFTSGILHHNQNPIFARQLAKTITRAFESYERLWKKILAEQELISLDPESVIENQTEAEQF